MVGMFFSSLYDFLFYFFKKIASAKLVTFLKLNKSLFIFRANFLQILSNSINFAVSNQV